jgi:hypothetical protein
MAKRIGLAFQEHGPRFIQGPRQAAQPRHHSPNQAMVHHRLVCGRREGRVRFFTNRITDQRAIVPNAFAIRSVWRVKIVLGAGQQTGSGKSLIRQYESPGGR